MVYIISLIALICFGGFHMWAKCLLGLLIAVALLDVAFKGKQKIGIKQYTPVILLFIMLITTFWAVDWTRNIEGVITGLVILGWMLLCCYTDKRKMEQLWLWLPMAGGLMTAVSLIAAVVRFPIQLWQADRLGGIFQYSNTCALFLFICIMAGTDKNNWSTYIKSQKSSKRSTKGKSSKKNGNRENETGKSSVVTDAGTLIHIGLLVVNLTGLLLTGSRSVMLMLVIWSVYKMVTDKIQRKLYCAGLGLSVAGVVAFAVLGIGTQNISRLTTLFTSNSTVWGRLLYYIDGIKMLVTHPFGMGYMGYYYVQGSVQTGVYSTMFVHNDFLQMGLDYGLVAMLLLVAFVGLQIIKGKQSRLAKEVMTAVSLASLADFHLQYIVIVMIMILCMDLELDFGVYEVCRNRLFNKNDNVLGSTIPKTGKKSVTAAGTMHIVIFSAAVLLAGYCLMTYGTLASGNYEAAARMFPAGTTAMENMMLKAEDSAEVMRLSEKILNTNKYNTRALNYRAYAAIVEGDYEEASACEKRAIDCARYNVKQYQTYDAMLTDMLAVLSMDSEDGELVKMLKQEQMQLPDKLKELESKTSSLAYKIKDKPVFEY